MAALRYAAGKLLYQRTQASIFSPAVEGRFVSRLVHNGPPAARPSPAPVGNLSKVDNDLLVSSASGAVKSNTVRDCNTQEDLKIVPAFKPDWDASKDITDPDDMDAVVERLQLIKSRSEELYELSSGLERYVTASGYHARFNRKLLWHLSSLVDERPNDPVWRQLRRKRRITNTLKVVGLILMSVFIARYQEEKKTGAAVKD